jgi:predicted nucleic acid-binding protein
VKGFLDTSVLVATFYGDHEHHAPSLDLFLRFGKKETACAANSLAETYTCLTGMPGKWRVGGDAALLFLRSIRENLTVVGLNGQEYFQVAQEAAAANIVGGAVYDALVGRCALKAKAQILYTWNTKDFLRLPGIGNRVKRPDE